MHVSNRTDRFMLRNTLLHTIFGLAACYKFTAFKTTSKMFLGKIIPCITDNFKPTHITQNHQEKETSQNQHVVNRMK